MRRQGRIQDSLYKGVPALWVGGGVGVKTYHFVKVSKKLHEIKKILDCRWAHARGAPLDFPLVIAHVCIHNVLTMAAQNKSMVKSVYKMKGAKSSICTF